MENFWTYTTTATPTAPVIQKGKSRRQEYPPEITCDHPLRFEYPLVEKQEIIKANLRLAAHVYNWGLMEKRRTKKQSGGSPWRSDLEPIYRRPSWFDPTVHSSQVVQQAFEELDRVYANFVAKPRLGVPRYWTDSNGVVCFLNNHTKKDRKSFAIELSPDGKSLKVPKVGQLALEKPVKLGVCEVPLFIRLSYEAKTGDYTGVLRTFRKDLKEQMQRRAA